MRGKGNSENVAKGQPPNSKIGAPSMYFRSAPSIVGSGRVGVVAGKNELSGILSEVEEEEVFVPQDFPLHALMTAIITSCSPRLIASRNIRMINLNAFG